LASGKCLLCHRLPKNTLFGVGNWVFWDMGEVRAQAGEETLIFEDKVFISNIWGFSGMYLRF